MLSVVLAVHNEELNLSKCLQSIAKIADEIIVVDGESTDRTVSIAKEFGAKIIVTTNKSNFHINKQIAMDAAKGDLVLQLDADEVVDDELAKYIVSIEQNKVDVNQEISAWWIPRKNYFLGAFLTKGGQYPDMVIRLYRNGKAALPQKDVHEQMTATGPVSTVKGHIIHYG